jgi:cyanophycinase
VNVLKAHNIPALVSAVAVGLELLAVAFVGLVPTDAAANTLAPRTETEGARPPSDDPRPVGQKLLISGGTLDDTLVGLYAERLIADVGGSRQLRLLIVPGASAEPTWLYSHFRRLLPLHGVPEQNIELAHIAALDDPATPVDEAEWRKGAYEPTEIDKVTRANVVWFSGGRQERLVRLLVDGAGMESPFQQAVAEKSSAGQLIVAGHSAGAAVMSDPMIGGGTSLGSLSLTPDPSCLSEAALCVRRGLGFVPPGYRVLVDQHFTQRGRLARLIRALASTDRQTGWGVGARAAFYVDLPHGRAEVLGVPGAAFVTVVGRDGAAANHEREGPPFAGDRYTVSVLAVGDRYDLPDSAHPHGIGRHPVADEYYAPFSSARGMRVLTDAFGGDVLTDRVAAYFADGTPQPSGPRVDALALNIDESGAAEGFRLRFTADQGSSVAYNSASGYSVFNARLGISSVSAHFDGLTP